MAEGQSSINVAATYPNPPTFLWESFTPNKVARFEAIRKANAKSRDSQNPPQRVTNLPPDLINLQPPPEPSDGAWRVFGLSYTLESELPNLEEVGIQRLGSQDQPRNDGERVLHLKRLAKSVLLNFLQLMDCASTDVDEVEPKIDDITAVLINLHHTINEYRPHQARESLILLLQDRLDLVNKETEAIKAITLKAHETLRGLGSLPVEKLETIITGPRAPDRENQGDMAEVHAEPDDDAEIYSQVDVECALD